MQCFVVGCFCLDLEIVFVAIFVQRSLLHRGDDGAILFVGMGAIIEMAVAAEGENVAERFIQAPVYRKIPQLPHPRRVDEDRAGVQPNQLPFGRGVHAFAVFFP